MSLKYKENNFSIEKKLTSYTPAQNNTCKTTRIDFLMKRIIAERKQEKTNIITLGTIILSIILIFYFFQY